MLTVTIYIISNPLGVPAHSFTKEEDAKKEMIKIYAELGEKYTLDQVALDIDDLFYKRIGVLLTNK